MCCVRSMKMRWPGWDLFSLSLSLSAYADGVPPHQLPAWLGGFAEGPRAAGWAIRASCSGWQLTSRSRSDRIAYQVRIRRPLSVPSIVFSWWRPTPPVPPALRLRSTAERHPTRGWVPAGSAVEGQQAATRATRTGANDGAAVARMDLACPRPSGAGATRHHYWSRGIRPSRLCTVHSLVMPFTVRRGVVAHARELHSRRLELTACRGRVDQTRCAGCRRARITPRPT
jgi:hypothetical protein